MREILLIEDDQGDVFLLREAFKACGAGVAITAAATGEEGLALLGSGMRPDLILMDLNLPGRDGCELIREIRKDRRHRLIPILMLTTSQSQNDVDMAYECGANAFMVKPMDLGQLELLAKRVCDFWFSAVRLPRA